MYVLSGADLLAGRERPVPNFFAENTANWGIRVAAKDLVIGDGATAGSRVTGYLGKDFAGGSPPRRSGSIPSPG